MLSTWKDAFKNIPEQNLGGGSALYKPKYVRSLHELKNFLDMVQIKNCLLKPFFNLKRYPLVEPRELLPSFEAELYEYTDLPGLSLVAFPRIINYFHEVFQFDILHCADENGTHNRIRSCPLEQTIIQNNLETFSSRLPKFSHEDFKKHFSRSNIANLNNYSSLLPYIFQMDRGHVFAQNMNQDFYLAGTYASFPSDLDTELKRFGLRIGKFNSQDNLLYELNRPFVYQFLMELYGFPIASERRTSAALFARRLFKMGEDFLVRVLGQSDRTLTTLYTHKNTKHYPQVEKIALVALHKSQNEQFQRLDKEGFLFGDKQKTAIVRVFYKQHKYDPNNIREDRALSISDHEIIHPLTGQTCRSVNLIKDTSLMTLKLNDIVKGEYTGRIRYKRNEIVEDTDTHEKRLKFLYAWLSKNQRRIIGYSDEFYARVLKVLDNYLLDPKNFETFKKMNNLYQEVWDRYSFIQQARKVRFLEDLKNREYKNKKLNYLEMLKKCTELINELKFEIVHYFDSLVERTLYLCNRILNDRYLQKKYVQKNKEQLTEYGKLVRKYYGRLVSLVDDIDSIRRTRLEQQKQTSSKKKYAEAI